MNVNKIRNSDLNMAASKTFEHVLDQVKASSLNFHLQQSPFSAVISIKKSFVKDKSGQILTPPPQSKPDDIIHLESENQALKKVNIKM